MTEREDRLALAERAAQCAIYNFDSVEMVECKHLLWVEMIAALRLSPVMAGWRCFHCDEVFSDEVTAKEHFGCELHSEPACKLNALEGGLLKLLRDQEEELRQHRSEQTAFAREFYALGADHYQAQRREEEKGYARGLADGAALSAPHPQARGEDDQPVAWRIRIRIGSATQFTYTERLPYEPDCDSRIVVLGEPEPLYARPSEATTGRGALIEHCANIALAIDSGRGNEKEIAKAIRALIPESLPASRNGVDTDGAGVSSSQDGARE